MRAGGHSSKMKPFGEVAAKPTAASHDENTPNHEHGDRLAVDEEVASRLVTLQADKCRAIGNTGTRHMETKALLRPAAWRQPSITTTCDAADSIQGSVSLPSTRTASQRTLPTRTDECMRRTGIAETAGDAFPPIQLIDVRRGARGDQRRLRCSGISALRECGGDGERDDQGRKELQKAFAAGDVAKLMGARRRMEAHERGHTRGGPRGSLPRARTELQRIAATLDPLSHKFLPHEANDLDEKLSKEVKVMKATEVNPICTAAVWALYITEVAKEDSSVTYYKAEVAIAVLRASKLAQ
ncbi:hypothetical protein PHYSODRAFT_327505 [Phytophthora sojae]|uniref:Uncharacterized protein n=1 Tax=Phytophthora sojae (strain P6497) TaxID=1094619 RepID=G4ZAK8_PHYSP|nr:hypothetical protein PHYSODRAFT_327505 [Phytophthora sojae]EGZ19205.1 hypothetical protein PHYSODRAFT_327505 [Phytophthora sojae]|eukprot:XP_009521922.1 hypothetical protein PHYSODRAFT_327505 [Phytophthora sojae]